MFFPQLAAICELHRTSTFLNQKCPIREVVPGLLKQARRFIPMLRCIHINARHLQAFAAEPVVGPPPAPAITKRTLLRLFAPVSAWYKKQTPYLFELLSPSPIA